MTKEQFFLYGGWLLAALANLIFLFFNLWLVRCTNKRMDEIDEMQDYLKRSYQHLHPVDEAPAKRTRIQSSDPGAA